MQECAKPAWVGSSLDWPHRKGGALRGLGKFTWQRLLVRNYFKKPTIGRDDPTRQSRLECQTWK